MRHIFLSLLLLATPLVAQQTETPPAPDAAPAPAAPAAPRAPAPAAPPVAPGSVKPDEARHVVRVNITNQNWDFSRPWGKRPPFSRRAVGAVIAGKRVLVSGELVANANYIELEKPEGGSKTPARIVAVDYECNLALLEPEEEGFLKDSEPLPFTEAKVGDTLNIWQLESTGVVLSTPGPLTTVEVSRYPVDDSNFLVYRASAAIQFRDSSFTLPVIKSGKLAGIVVRYDNASNAAEIVPTPVIKHFLEDAAKAPYEGFPRTGIGFSNTRDPQFRKFVGLDGNGGVYVNEVHKDSPAAKAGMKKGDIVLSINGNAIDQDGNYVDPEYGKLALIHLVSTRHFVGEKLTFSILREGKPQDLAVTLEHRGVESYTIEPYVIDRAPKFYILGGLVLQELSRQYLKEFGNDWYRRGPQELVYYDRYQGELFADGPKKLVILSRVLPMPSTLGYEDLHHLRITKVNGVALQELADLPGALEKAQDGVHRIEFDSDPGVIFLDATTLQTDEQTLIKTYRLPATKRL